MSSKSIAKLISIKKPQDVEGLKEVANEMNIPLEYVEKEELAKVEIPNPSETVKDFEGTPSVSEAAIISFRWRIDSRKAEIPTKFDNSHSEDSRMKRGLLLIDRGSREQEASKNWLICKKVKEKRIMFLQIFVS